jgi:hypothetical protein
MQAPCDLPQPRKNSSASVRTPDYYFSSALDIISTSTGRMETKLVKEQTRTVLHRTAAKYPGR